MNVPEEAYRLAADAYNEACRRMVGDIVDAKLAERSTFRSAVNAVWPLAVAEGRRQAAGTLRSEVAAARSAIKRARLEAIAEWLDPTPDPDEEAAS